MRNTLKIPLFILLIISSTGLAQTQFGKASFYADKFEGRSTASGEKYRHKDLTAAHRSLPFGTKVKVTNVDNNKSVVVSINDRGPYVENRIIDLSKSAAKKLDFLVQGLANVKLEIVDAGSGKESSSLNLESATEVVPDEKEFYDFKTTRINPVGFGVQIGTYKELINLMRLSNNLKNSYRKRVVIRVKDINGQKFYSIILGKYSSREKADNFLNLLKKKYPDAFIVDYGGIFN